MTDPRPYWLGLDPGKSGALALVSPVGQVHSFHSLRVVGKGTQSRVDVDDLQVWWDLEAQPEGNRNVILCVERVSSMPSDSAKSSFSFGRALGQVEGWAEARGLPRVDVLPKDWQGLFLRGYPRGTYKQRKASATRVARDRYPALRPALRLAKNQGLADAALIADCARLRYEAQR